MREDWEHLKTSSDVLEYVNRHNPAIKAHMHKNPDTNKFDVSLTDGTTEVASVSHKDSNDAFMDLINLLAHFGAGVV